MVLIFDGNSEIGAFVRSDLCYMNCLRHLIRSRAVTSRIFFFKMPTFSHACSSCSTLPSIISTMGSILRIRIPTKSGAKTLAGGTTNKEGEGGSNLASNLQILTTFFCFSVHLETPRQASWYHFKHKNCLLFV